MSGKVYLTCMGELYALTVAQYKKFMAAVAANGSADVSQFGKQLTYSVADVSDLTQSQAETILGGKPCGYLPTIGDGGKPLIEVIG